MCSITGECDISKKEFHKRKIYRVISFQRLAEILVHQYNTLVHPSKWGDPFEKWRLRDIKKQDNNIPIDVNNYFGQCWTLETKQVAMWELYSKGTDGFRIQTTVGKLLKSLKRPCIIAKVSYKSVEEILQNDYGNCFCKLWLCSDADCLKKECSNNKCSHDKHLNIAKKFMIKREGFKHEKEVRFMCYVNKNTRNSFKYKLCSSGLPRKIRSRQQEQGYFRYEIDPNELIEQIMVHPRVENYHNYNALKCVLQKIGFENTIKRSQLLESRLLKSRHSSS